MATLLNSMRFFRCWLQIMSSVALLAVSNLRPIHAEEVHLNAAMSAVGDCAIYQAVIAQRLKLKGKSYLPLAAEYESKRSSEMNQADSNYREEFTGLAHIENFSQLSAPEKEELRVSIRAGVAPSPRLNCKWRGFSFPPEPPPPDHRYCWTIHPVPQLDDPAVVKQAEADKESDANRVCPFPGAIELSRPHRTKDGRWALLDVGVRQGPLSGSGSVCLLEKKDDHWRIVQCEPLWIS